MRRLLSQQETLQAVKTAVTVNAINVYDIMKYETVILTKDAVANNRGGVRIMADLKYYDVILKPVITEKSYDSYGREEVHIRCTHRSNQGSD